MKICDTIVIFSEIAPYGQRVCAVAVKCAVNKFYLRDAAVKKLF